MLSIMRNVDLITDGGKVSKGWFLFVEIHSFNS
jgi:hypothetical protein